MAYLAEISPYKNKHGEETTFMDISLALADLFSVSALLRSNPDYIDGGQATDSLLIRLTTISGSDYFTVDGLL